MRSFNNHLERQECGHQIRPGQSYGDDLLQHSNGLLQHSDDLLQLALQPLVELFLHFVECLELCVGDTQRFIFLGDAFGGLDLPVLLSEHAIVLALQLCQALPSGVREAWPEREGRRARKAAREGKEVRRIRQMDSFKLLNPTP